MAVSITSSGGKGYLEKSTFSVTGGSATTAYLLVVTPPSGHTQTFPFITDGSGNATINFYKTIPGQHTVAVKQDTLATVASLTF